MIARYVVEVLLEEQPNFKRADQVFNGEIPFGFIGVVDNGHVRASVGGLEYVDHSELGYTQETGRWRFATNRRIPVVLWTTPPTMAQIFEVEEWLKKKGYEVASHTQDFNKWRGF